MTIEELEQKVAALEARNKKVETNKAWETSKVRVATLVVLTYLIIVLTLLVIQNPNPWINAVIPAVGFYLSTLTLPFVKRYWVKYIYKKNS